MIGQTISHYRIIIEKLGGGGMGVVYRARDSVLKREVAIKVLPSFVSQEPDRLRRFEQEARAAAALNHPNILAVFQLGTYQGAPYLVSELLEGETLRQQMMRSRLALRKVIDYGVQIARGLAAAHVHEPAPGTCSRRCPLHSPDRLPRSKWVRQTQNHARTRAKPESASRDRSRES